MIMSQFSLDMNRHQYVRDISLVLDVIYLLGIVVMYSVSEYFGYSVGMILIGIAWNFSYSSSTLLLSDCYRVDYSVTLSFFLISPLTVANGGLSRARSE
jgi:hypothetical protein